MSRKRSAVEPSECENVAKKSKKKRERSSTRDFIREVKSLQWLKKKSKKKGKILNQGLYQRSKISAVAKKK